MDIKCLITGKERGDLVMKKIVAGVVSACIAFSPVVTPAFAKESFMSISSSSESSTDSETLKSVILMAKEKIDIPSDLTEFSYRFNSSNNKYSKSQYWSLTWRDKDNDKSVNVKITSDGHILDYSLYDYNKENSKPTYLKEELTENVLKFIEKVVPEVSGKIKLKSSEFSGVYSGAYSYVFERIENGVKMPDNTVTVSVDYETGAVKSLNVNWTFDVLIPDAEVKISIDEAREKIGEKVNMELKYMNREEEKDGKKFTKAYLVYVPDKSYVAVDAKTGEIYETHDDFLDMSEYALDQKSFANLETAADSAFTEQEIIKLEEMKGLITKVQAISAVTSKRDVLLLDENAKAVNASLIQKYDYRNKVEGEYIWNISFSDPRDVDYDSGDTYRAYSSATVDAKTGKLISFYSSVRGYYDSESKEWETVNVKYTNEECEDIFEKFAKSLEAEKFANTKLSDSNDFGYLLKYVNEEPVYGGYLYDYSRVNEGIEYSYNKISGAVDGVTGKIYSYNVNWTDDVEFESPKGIMSKDEAYKAYSEKDGFELVYEINNKHYIENNPEQTDYYDYSDLYALEKEVRLVYRTDISPQYISPFTGEQLDYSGKVFEDKTEKKYDDILGYWGERSIKLITDMGYSFEGNEFLPNKAISKEEFIGLLQVVGTYIDEDKYENLEKITKLDAIKMLVDRLGLDKVAKLSEIYTMPFSDDVSREDIGYLALAKGLGIVSGDGNNICNPGKELSRIEAVCMALQFANVK